MSGKMPFRDFFPEYPPLVFLYTGIPAVIDPSLEWYFPIFRALTCAVDCGIWVMLLWAVGPGCRAGIRPDQAPAGAGEPPRFIERARRPVSATESFAQAGGAVGKPPTTRAPRLQRGGWDLLLYVVGTMALGPLIYDRIDLVLAAMLLGATLALYRGRERLFQFLVGLGIAFKLIPIVLVPMILAREWRRRRVSLVACDRIEGAESNNFECGTVGRAATTLRTLSAFVLLALPTLVSFGSVALLGGSRFDKLFQFHAERPIQIESGPAAVEMVFMMFGSSGSVTFKYGSANLETVYGGVVVAAGSMLLGSACLGSALFTLRQRSDERQFAMLLASVLSAAMVFSKVLSPQFFLILLPVLTVLSAPTERIAAIGNWLLIALIFVMTGMIFPWYYSTLIRLDVAPQFLVIARNECLLALCISLAYRADRRFRVSDLSAKERNRQRPYPQAERPHACS